MAGSGEKWRWADPQGVQRVMHSDELRAALGCGSLPPYILVWRPGMTEWQPAYLVAELATIAISAQQGVIPSVPPPPPAIVAVQAEFEHRVASFDDQTVEVEPPPPPVHQYAAIAAAVPAHLKRQAPVDAPPAAAPAAPEPAPPPEPELELEPEPEEPVVAAPPPPQTTTPPPVVPRVPHTPRPPVTAPPRATPSVLPPRVVDLSPRPNPTRAPEPSTRPPDSVSRPPPSHAPPPVSVRVADGSHVPPLPSLPGVVRSAPPPPPRRSQPVPPYHGPSAHGQLPLPVAPLPVPPPSRFLVEGQAHAPIVMPAPPHLARPSGENGGPSELSPHPLESPFGPLTHENGATGVGDFPAFPLDETKSDPGRAPLPSDPVEIPLDRGIGSKVFNGLRDARDSLRPIADRAMHSIGPLAGRARDRVAPLSNRAKQWMSTNVAPTIEGGLAHVKANPKDPKVLLGLGAVALLVLVALIAIAASAGSSRSTAATEPASSAAKPSEAPSAAPTSKVGALVVPTAPIAASAPAPLSACRLTKEAVRLAGSASKDVPIELAVNDGGDRARVGFATGGGIALGLAIDLASFRVTPDFSTPVKGSVRAVLPLSAEGAPVYAVNADGPGDRLRAWRTLFGASPSVIGWAESALAVASKSTDAPSTVWRLDGDEPPDTIRVALAGEDQAIVLRRRGEILGGMLDADRKPIGNLVHVSGAGAPAGSPIGAPALAANARSVAVAFADRADSSEPWAVRVGSSHLGSFPSKTTAFTVPVGGPGGVAIAPALAGLSGDRWLLVWTEGGGGDHDVRAQTLNDELRPIGAAFTVSRAGANAGQGAVALNGGQGLVTYLTLTPRGYEVWGAGVDCR